MKDFTKRKDFYEYCKPENRFRTYRRLKEIQDMGMTITGEGSFGILGIMSGLYIEKVWSYSDEDWRGYIDWVKSVRIKSEKELEGKMVEEIVKYKPLIAAITCVQLARDYYLNVHEKKVIEDDDELEVIDSRGWTEEDSRELLLARIERSQELVNTHSKVVDKLTTALRILDAAGHTTIPKEQWGVHETHCCKDHGCKYNDAGCPVYIGITNQRYDCEDCNDE